MRYVASIEDKNQLLSDETSGKYMKRNLISGFIAFILFTYNILDYRTNYSSEISFVLMLLWVLTAMIENSRILRYTLASRKNLFLIMFLIYYFIGFESSTNIVTAINSTLGMVLPFSCIFIYDFYIRDNLIVLKKLSNSLIWVLVYASVRTLLALKLDPNFARQLASGTVTDIGNGTGGGYKLVYAVVLLIPCLVFKFAKVKQTKTDMFLQSVQIIVFVTLIIKANYTIALLFSLAGILSIFLFSGKIKKVKNGYDKRKSTSLKLVVVIFSSILILLFGRIIVVALLKVLLVFFGGNAFLSSRINDVILTFQNNFISSDLQSRIFLYNVSWNTFKTSPLFGIFNNYSKFPINSGYIYIGDHSEILDTFAKYGLIGAINLFAFIMLGFKDIQKNNPYSNVSRFIFYIFIGLSLINRMILPSVLCVLYLIVPGVLINIKAKTVST